MDAKQKVIVQKIADCPAPALLEGLNKDFEKKLIKVTDGIHVAVGFGLANAILVEAPHGVIVVDTTETKWVAEEVNKLFKEVTDKPLKAIIYTHSHEDHVGGSEAFVSRKDAKDIEIWAHEKFTNMATSMDQTMLRQALIPRILRQFGMSLPNFGSKLNSGIGPFLRKGKPHMLWPNKLVKGKSIKLNIAGLDLELFHFPGETPCQMGVWIPSKKVLLPGDNFYKAFPNLYAIRGTSPRDVNVWVESLDLMRALKADFLVPSHTLPVSGNKEVFTALTCYRDAIQYVHDQTVRMLNQGHHPTEVARAVKLPTTLRDLPYLQSFYGTPEWSSRAVCDSYIGWFSGAVEELFPLTPSAKAQKMTEYFGKEQVLNAAEKALQNKDWQWALELSSYIYRLNTDDQKALDIRSEAMLQLASQQVSANARNYFLTSLAEDHGIHARRHPTIYVIRNMPLDTCVKKMRYCLQPNMAENHVITAEMTVKDTQQKYVLSLRNCILQISKGGGSNPDFTFALSNATLREVLAGNQAGDNLTDGIETNNLELLNRFFGLFDFGDDLEGKALKARL